jgi:hypothetical protein
MSTRKAEQFFIGQPCAGIIAATRRKIRKKRLCGKCGRFMPQQRRAEYASLN